VDAAGAVVLDFYGDRIEILREELRQRGHKPPPDAMDVAVRYFDLRRREISLKPRVVLRAEGLACPGRCQPALEEIARKAAAGEDLTPHLSEKLRDLHYDDDMLNDWGLHHLHLSTNVRANGFVTRTKPVLFVRVTNDRFLMIAVLDHGRKVSPPWAKMLLLERLRENWPEQLTPIPGVCGLVDRPTEAEHIKLRKRIVLAVQLSDGHVYFPLGGGSTTAGSSAQAIDAHDQWAFRLRATEDAVRRNLEKLRSLLRPEQKFGDPPHFKLGLLGTRIYAVETTAKVAFLLK
jgi:hypothetical protein